MPQAQPDQHPVTIPANFDVSQCVTCHSDKQQGKYVHTAMAAGCTTCHQIETKNDVTRITLLAPAPQLCATCHSPIDAPVKHQPYGQGQCLLCHDPHSSANGAQTLAPTNKLCLGCHEARKVTGDTVPLFAGATTSVAEFNAAPKIQLDPSGRVGHPYIGHPVTGYPDPFAKGQPLSCVSCHNPHASSVENLLSDKFKSVTVCDDCHQAEKAAQLPKSGVKKQ